MTTINSSRTYFSRTINFIAAMLTVMLLTFMVSGVAFAQLSGTKTINSAGGADYASISAAVTALNSGGVGSGGVTFDVAAGH